MTNKPSITELEQIIAQATQGPWFQSIGSGSGKPCVVSKDTWICGQLINSGLREEQCNLDLIAASRQALPNALALIKVLKEALESCYPGDYSTGHVIDPSYDETAVTNALAQIAAFEKNCLGGGE